jgi:hypothetical protein
MKLKLLFFDINSFNNEIDKEKEENQENQENKEKELNDLIIDIFINEHIVVGKKINNDKDNPENNFISFTYQVKAGRTANIFFYKLNDLNKIYSINLIVDAYFILVDIEEKNSFIKLNKVIEYIKEYCPEKVETYILGIYKNKNNIIEEFNESKIKKFLNKKQLLYSYQNVLLMIEDNEYKQINETFEDILFKLFEYKTNYKEKNEKNEQIYDLDEDKSRSRCNLF